ncbi:MAG: hypothetical protein KF730_02050 [Sphingomonas sp.]|uniref:hypothetical protein n=1 Tax=Sphingomonas sp. TaxID=28214 RepID=UPI0025DC8F91|nr:hypothetical protein [Sphingomonas sp.]MBX3563336.1 hypothetical protein [Sphingomonas sp.]
MRGVWKETERHLIGQPLRLMRRENDWAFDFGDAATICVGCLWRMRSEALLLTSEDSDRQFGLPEPIDAASRCNEIVAGAVVDAIAFDQQTGDLTLDMSNGVKVELITDSSGYESWQVYAGDELRAVGGNGGLR